MRIKKIKNEDGTYTRYTMSYQFDREEFNRICWFSSIDVPYKRSDPRMQRCLEKLKSVNQL